MVSQSGLRADYVEQAVNVIAQTDRTAFNIFDERLLKLGRKFDDFRNAEAAGAVITADTITELADRLGLPGEDLAQTLERCAASARQQAADSISAWLCRRQCVVGCKICWRC